MAAIRLDGIAKRFGPTVVADALSLDIAQGEFFTFLGPSGCGKSTLLHLIAGVDAPDAGRILLDGRDVTDAAPQHRDVAMVFQSYALYPHMSVAENLAFPLRNRRHGSAHIAAEVARVAAVLGLESLLERRPRQLSGGQRQRVALGRALIRRPAVFLMDEPLSNLDASMRLDLREEIKRLHRETGITTVYVTHDQEEAMVLSDRVALLRQGAVVQCDAPDRLYACPCNLFAARFVGSPPMNILPAASLISVPALRRALADRNAAQTDMGIRPEDVSVAAEHSEDAWAAQVVLVESVGAATWVIAQRDSVRIKGLWPRGRPVKVGDPAYCSFDAATVHLFSRDHGVRLN